MAISLRRLFHDPKQRTRIERRLAEKLDRSGGPQACWPWKGKMIKGRGRIMLDGKIVLVPRVVFALQHGYDPGELCVLHSCDNPRCGNPDHLFPGTHADNMHDRHAKGGYTFGESHVQAKLTEAQAVAILADRRASRVVGAEYGVAHSTVLQIRRGAKWKHLRRAPGA